MNEYCSVARFLGLVFVVVTLAGCGEHSQLASQLATPKGPIAVEAKVDGKADIATSLDGNAPKVTLSFGGGRRVVVELERIRVDDEVVAAVPAGTQKVEIAVAGGKVTLMADGKALTK